MTRNPESVRSEDQLRSSTEELRPHMQFFLPLCSGLVGTIFSVVITLLFNAESPGSFLTFVTIRLSFVCFIVFLMVVQLPGKCPKPTILRIPRAVWTIGWVLFLLHLVSAFHFYHNWSHQSAWDATQRQSGYGDGIYLNYAFGLFWTLDIMFWWLVPVYRRQQMKWWHVALMAFMAFMMINAAVVFAALPMQLLAGAMFLVLGLATLKRLRGQ